MFRIFSDVIVEAFVDASLIFSVHTGCIAHIRAHFFHIPITSFIGYCMEETFAVEQISGK